ncbi:PAS domain S-box protein [Reichenbachiella carrageenanivorans]|uniref:histidine kinase n=1 Tax=Reichenbachiella carrageenanivorans TaxID=2979869 RepID=A0ABY6D3S3_9BACT|nr:PAS domain S-box protein [Reichenbachiella carrageenanivorans]UXX79708.1 PAS domain S-box protein [Reichenbachiella carrageenanivorans]
MIAPKNPANEKERLVELYSYHILDTAIEQSFDDITKIAAQICDSPISLVSLIDKDRQWFKSRHGLEATETPRELAYCAHAIHSSQDLLEVPDAFEDERFHDNPLAIGDPHVRFYAGAPLVTTSGYALGTLCVIDHQPKKLTKGQKEALWALSRQVTALLELKKSNRILEETKLAQSQTEQTFRNRLERIGDMVYELDPKGMFIYVNPVLVRMSGFSEEQLLKMHFSNLVHESDAKRVSNYYVHTLKNKIRSSYLEFKMKGENGPVWVGQTVEIEFDGALGVRTFGVARNIQELVEARDRMEKSEAMYRLLSEHSTDMICLHEPDGRYSYLSSSVKDLLGYEPEELIGVSLYDLIHPDLLDKFKTEVHSKSIDNQSFTGVESRLRKKDGTYVWVELYYKPILNENNEVISLQSSTRDISKRRKYDDAIQVAMKLAEKAKLEAIESAKAKENFLSTMSHEIRTPLNAILGVTNLLLMEELEQKHLDHLNLLKFSGENLLSLINDILDYNKIESGKVDIEKVDFDLSEILMNLKQSVMPEVNKKGLELVLQYDEQLPNIFVGDPIRVTQIISNLLSNAIKFTEEGFIKIDVTLGEKKEGMAQVHFEIHDTGIGIEPDNQSLIFENFAQASDDTTRKFGGTGLGLAITKKLLLLMGSEIHLDSELGYGSIFYFDIHLPIGNASDVDGEIKNNLLVFENVAHRNIHLLVAEDNRANQIVLEKFLQKWGMKMDFVENGRLALERSKTERYDLILMDLQMPEMDGYQATQAIRKLSTTYAQHLPIIALTASALLDVRKKVKELGMTDYITKPFSPEELYKKILKNLGKVLKRTAIIEDNPIHLRLHELSEGDVEFKKELTAHYLDQYEGFINKYLLAMTESNEKLLQEACNGIKTSNEVLGYHGLDSVINDAHQALLDQGKSKEAIIQEATKSNETIIATLRDILSSEH